MKLLSFICLMTAMVLSMAGAASQKSDKKIVRQKGSVAFQSEGVGVASKYERPVEAEKRAENNAVSKALRNAGVDVFYGFSDHLSESNKKSYQMVASYMWTFSQGVARWKRVAEPVCIKKQDNSTECRVAVKGKILLKGKPDPSFEILPENGGLSQSVYGIEDDVQVSFRVSQDALVYILSVDEAQNVHMVFPNRIFKNNKVKAGQVLTFPEKDAGMALMAYLPDGKNKSVEMLQIIATKGVPLITLGGVKDRAVGPYTVLSAGSLNKVMSKVGKLKRSHWTMMVFPYEIQR